MEPEENAAIGCIMLVFLGQTALAVLDVVSGKIKMRKWRAAGRRLGMHFSFPSAGLTLARDADGLVVEQSSHGAGIHLRIDGLSSDLHLEAENRVTRTLAPDLLVGDAQFDLRIRLHAPPPLAFAILDPETRHRIVELLGGGAGRVRGGCLELEMTGLDELEARLESVLDTARRLRVADDELPKRLLERVRAETMPGVRVRCLRALLESFPDTRLAESAVDLALSSERIELQLEAACFAVGRRRPFEALEGRSARSRRGLAVDTLVQLAKDPRVPVPSRRLAIEALLEADLRADVLPVLEHVLVSSDPDLGRLAIEGFGRLRHRAAAGRLAELAAEADEATAEAIARTLGKIGDASTEPALLRLVAREDSGVSEAAIDALAAVGTVAAVETLLELRGRFALGRLARSAERAIRAIQGRQTGAEQGLVSLAASDELDGALSLAPPAPEGGEVSLVEEPESGSAASRS